MSKVTKEINKISLAVISISGKIVFCVLTVMLLVTGAKNGYAFGHSIFYAPGMEAAPGRDMVLKLDGSETLSQVGAMLENAGLIRNDKAFVIQATCYDYEVKKGTFDLNTSMSSREIIDLLSEETEEDES